HQEAGNGIAPCGISSGVWLASGQVAEAEVTAALEPLTRISVFRPVVAAELDAVSACSPGRCIGEREPSVSVRGEIRAAESRGDCTGHYRSPKSYGWSKSYGRFSRSIRSCGRFLSLCDCGSC